MLLVNNNKGGKGAVNEQQGRQGRCARTPRGAMVLLLSNKGGNVLLVSIKGGNGAVREQQGKQDSC